MTDLAHNIVMSAESYILDPPSNDYQRGHLSALLTLIKENALPISPTSYERLEGMVTSMPLFVGIDADINGAIALIDFEAGFAEAYHLPKEKVYVKSKRLSRSRLADAPLAVMFLELMEAEPKALFIEEQRAFGNDGAPHAFTHGRTYGSLRAGAAAAAIATNTPMDISFIPPLEWKTEYGLIFPELPYKEKKKKAVAFASEVFPNHKHLWEEAQIDTSLAEALLICMYGAFKAGAKVTPGDKLFLPVNPTLSCLVD